MKKYADIRCHPTYTSILEPLYLPDYPLRSQQQCCSETIPMHRPPRAIDATCSSVTGQLTALPMPPFTNTYYQLNSLVRTTLITSTQLVTSVDITCYLLRITHSEAHPVLVYQYMLGILTKKTMPAIPSILRVNHAPHIQLENPAIRHQLPHNLLLVTKSYHMLTIHHSYNHGIHTG